MSRKEEVLNFLQTIPKGKVVSYKFLAKKFWTHPRAIAMFMKYNKSPEIYPCYKVVKENGDISWYSGQDGVTWKQKRLEIDGVKIENNQVNRECFLEN